ncbi:hypothetical protein LOK49_LG07G00321 [Camellia lanceoleosa]|uniref:Uncharacterized protein n=1 Tax=Camellia lanceoleosa TaxID=1840588 RepID=A0ACC0H4V2_9ERIC|nr:hypothetical protein LOK49_LG07G00321 [Camellia lanceoleosa]
MELDDLNKNLEELGKINEKQEKRVRYHSIRAQILTVSILIIQALIYESLLHITTTTTTTIQCKNWWIPFALPLLSFTLFSFSFLDAATSFYRSQYQMDLNSSKYSSLRFTVRDILVPRRSAMAIE